MAIEFSEEQFAAVRKMKNGCILCGGVGSGKSRAALFYYYTKVCDGDIRIINWDLPFCHDKWLEMKKPRDLYIITTAKKRDTLEWEDEAGNFGIGKDGPVKFVVDSWNNIKKYSNAVGSFFIFDEQRVVGSGVWVKAFLRIARRNQWVLLSATPGDQWSDYIPVFLANGFYKSKTEFHQRHSVYSRMSKYPKIERYIDTDILEQRRREILVYMKDERETERINHYVIAEYDHDLYRAVFRDRWNPYDDEPIAETGKLMYLLRKVVNSDESRLDILERILEQTEINRFIIFYNFDYELEMLIRFCNDKSIAFSMWNGHKHDDLPLGERWIYLVQYSAGCEGWNCISTDTVIFFSQNYSYRVVEQASGRIDRRNTPYKYLNYYHIRSTAPIDMAIYRALKTKKIFNERAFLSGNC